MITNPLPQQVEEWAAKAAAGEMNAEEMREVVRTLRQGRISSAQKSTAPSKGKVKEVNMNQLMDELDNL